MRRDASHPGRLGEWSYSVAAGRSWLIERLSPAAINALHVRYGDFWRAAGGRVQPSLARHGLPDNQRDPRELASRRLDAATSADRRRKRRTATRTSRRFSRQSPTTRPHHTRSQRKQQAPRPVRTTPRKLRRETDTRHHEQLVLQKRAVPEKAHAERGDAPAHRERQDRLAQPRDDRVRARGARWTPPTLEAVSCNLSISCP